MNPTDSLSPSGIGSRSGSVELPFCVRRYVSRSSAAEKLRPKLPSKVVLRLPASQRPAKSLINYYCQEIYSRNLSPHFPSSSSAMSAPPAKQPSSASITTPSSLPRTQHRRRQQRDRSLPQRRNLRVTTSCPRSGPCPRRSPPSCSPPSPSAKPASSSSTIA
jgi:hypothetical protein